MSILVDFQVTCVDQKDRDLVISSLSSDDNLAFLDWETQIMDRLFCTTGSLGHSVIAYIDSIPVGLLLGGVANCRACLNHIWIDERYRGNGISRAMIKHFCNQEPSIKFIYALVLKNNLLGKVLFKKLGFTDNDEVRKIFFLEKDLLRPEGTVDNSCRPIKPACCELLGFRGTLVCEDNANWQEVISDIPNAENWLVSNGIYRTHLLLPAEVAVDKNLANGIMGFELRPNETLFTATTEQIQTIRQ